METTCPKCKKSLMKMKDDTDKICYPGEEDANL